MAKKDPIKEAKAEIKAATEEQTAQERRSKTNKPIGGTKL